MFFVVVGIVWYVGEINGFSGYRDGLKIYQNTGMTEFSRYQMK